MPEEINENQPPLSVYIEEPETARACRVCGCTNDDACVHPDHGNCWWVRPDLCSHCHYWPGEATRYSILQAEAAAEGAFAD